MKSGTLVSSPNLYPPWEIVSVSVLFKVLDLKIVMPTIWNIEQEKDERRRQASEDQREKGRQRSRARDKKQQQQKKNKGDIFLLET